MYIAKNSTIKGLEEAFGFNVVVISSNNFEAHGELRTRYTVKRPNGKKFYHAVQFSNGEIHAM